MSYWPRPEAVAGRHTISRRLEPYDIPFRHRSTHRLSTYASEANRDSDALFRRLHEIKEDYRQFKHRTEVDPLSRHYPLDSARHQHNRRATFNTINNKTPIDIKPSYVTIPTKVGTIDRNITAHLSRAASPHLQIEERISQDMKMKLKSEQSEGKRYSPDFKTNQSSSSPADSSRRNKKFQRQNLISITIKPFNIDTEEQKENLQSNPTSANNPFANIELNYTRPEEQVSFRKLQPKLLSPGDNTKNSAEKTQKVINSSEAPKNSPSFGQHNPEHHEESKRPHSVSGFTISFENFSKFQGEQFVSCEPPIPSILLNNINKSRKDLSVSKNKRKFIHLVGNR